MLITARVGEHLDRPGDWDTRWEGQDKGLITAWLAGQEKARTDAALVAKAQAGELPVLPFRGGVERAIKSGNKLGHLLYVAMWQGLRGDDLRVDTEDEVTMTCARHGVRVLYTASLQKLLQSEDEA